MTSGAWVLGLLSLYLAWGVRLQGLALFIPLFGFTLALIMNAFALLLCLWQLCRAEKTREEAAVFVVMGFLALIPLTAVAREYRSASGPANQFLLKLLMSPP